MPEDENEAQTHFLCGNLTSIELETLKLISREDEAYLGLERMRYHKNLKCLRIVLHGFPLKQVYKIYEWV